MAKNKSNMWFAQRRGNPAPTISSEALIAQRVRSRETQKTQIAFSSQDNSSSH